MLELPSTVGRPRPPRRLGITAAAAAIVVGSVFLASPAVTSAPAHPSNGVAASILACKLRVIRQAPIAAPATDTFSSLTASSAAAGYKISGVVTATHASGTQSRLPWTCATEQRGTDWYPWSVNVG
jgi:hypothetical protein